MIGQEEEALLRREGPRSVFPEVAVVLLPTSVLLGVISLGLGSWLAAKDVRYFNYTDAERDAWNEMGWKEGVWAGTLEFVFGLVLIVVFWKARRESYLCSSMVVSLISQYVLLGLLVTFSLTATVLSAMVAAMIKEAKGSTCHISISKTCLCPSHARFVNVDSCEEVFGQIYRVHIVIAVVNSLTLLSAAIITIFVRRKKPCG